MSAGFGVHAKAGRDAFTVRTCTVTAFRNAAAGGNSVLESLRDTQAAIRSWLAAA
jgi:hypothetical protein